MRGAEGRGTGPGRWRRRGSDAALGAAGGDGTARGAGLGSPRRVAAVAQTAAATPARRSRSPASPEAPSAAFARESSTTASSSVRSHPPTAAASPVPRCFTAR